MENNFREINIDVEQAIDYAFEGKFVIKFYDYLKIRKTKRDEIDQFIESSTVAEISNLIIDLEEYLEGGNDEMHKQLREGYGHIRKPEARKIRKYLYGILEDAWKYEQEKRPGRKRKTNK
ncbi:MAG TPA: hypothetical protein DCX27_03095 [Balneola sp.]|nr:hypothetical protein [Balneola sp.]